MDAKIIASSINVIFGITSGLLTLTGFLAAFISISKQKALDEASNLLWNLKTSYYKDALSPIKDPKEKFPLLRQLNDLFLKYESLLEHAGPNDISNSLVNLTRTVISLTGWLWCGALLFYFWDLYGVKWNYALIPFATIAIIIYFYFEYGTQSLANSVKCRGILVGISILFLASSTLLYFYSFVELLFCILSLLATMCVAHVLQQFIRFLEKLWKIEELGELPTMAEILDCSKSLSGYQPFGLFASTVYLQIQREQGQKVRLYVNSMPFFNFSIEPTILLLNEKKETIKSCTGTKRFIGTNSSCIRNRTKLVYDFSIDDQVHYVKVDVRFQVGEIKIDIVSEPQKIIREYGFINLNSYIMRWMTEEEMREMWPEPEECYTEEIK